MYTLGIFLVVYGFLALTHILVQLVFAHGEHRKQKSKKFHDFHNGHTATVSVVVPCFNENPEWLDQCLNSIASQDYPELEAIVVDDGSKNRQQLLPVFEKYKNNEMFHFILQENGGKREAHKAGFDMVRGEIIVTIDSDTIIEAPHGIRHIIKQFKDPKVGAVTGDVRVVNKKENFLTQLISYRYWTAFHQERAAQSLFNVLMCCSGPFSAYRRSVLEKVKKAYVSQIFLGQKCTYGDDRHLTNLVLEEGHQVRFDNKAVSYTYVPNTLWKYVRQQIRWNKSFYREMLWTLKHIHKHHFYMTYELLMQFLLPFLLLIALASVVIQAVFIDASHLWKYLVVLMAIALLRAIYGIYRTGDFGFLRFIVYGFMHVLLLIPVRLYSIATLKNVKWGTR